MANLPPARPPAGGTAMPMGGPMAGPIPGFTPNPHHERQLKSDLGASDGIRMLELALELAKIKGEDQRSAAAMVADAEEFFAALQHMRSA